MTLSFFFFNNYFLKVLDSVMMLLHLCDVARIPWEHILGIEATVLSDSHVNTVVNSAISLIFMKDSLYCSPLDDEEWKTLKGRNTLR